MGGCFFVLGDGLCVGCAGCDKLRCVLGMLSYTEMGCVWRLRLFIGVDDNLLGGLVCKYGKPQTQT